MYIYIYIYRYIYIYVYTVTTISWPWIELKVLRPVHMVPSSLGSGCVPSRAMCCNLGRFAEEVVTLPITKILCILHTLTQVPSEEGTT